MDWFQPFLLSFVTVALSEMGDKTQLLAFALTAKFRKPFFVMGGILTATLACNLAASVVGDAVAGHLSRKLMSLVLAVSFLVFGVWVLKADDDDGKPALKNYGAFLTTAVLFLLAELGDKTQLATVALAARYQQVLLVTLGTTLGMATSDGLAVFLGQKIAHKLEMKYIRYVTSTVFFLFAAVSFIEWWRS